tara:strand:- start:4 stop:1056 length:1053 start_codon:yes stop_codon:yes gene_type:complete
MLQATYNNNTYTFYVTLQDASSNKLSNSYNFLLKFTNDMSGAVKWGYGQNVTVNDRYCKLEIHSTESGTVAESVFGGVVNFDPNGYWKYEIYLVASGTGSNCGLPNPTEVGTWDCTNVAGTSIDSGNMNVDVYEIITLSADTYTIDDYTTCDPPPTGTPSGYQLTQVISSRVCDTTDANPPRYLLFTRVVRNVNTNTFFIDSLATVGSQIRIYNSTRTYTHNITTQPENIEINIDCNPEGQIYTVELWKGGSLIDTYNNISPLSSNVYPSAKAILASNNYYTNPTGLCSNQVTEGSIFFGWRSQDNTVNDYVQAFPLEIGKLLVSEQVGEEQVQYTEREAPASTNYIYND